MTARTACGNTFLQVFIGAAGGDGGELQTLREVEKCAPGLVEASRLFVLFTVLGGGGHQRPKVTVSDEVSHQRQSDKHKIGCVSSVLTHITTRMG